MQGSKRCERAVSYGACPFEQNLPLSVKIVATVHEELGDVFCVRQLGQGRIGVKRRVRTANELAFTDLLVRECTQTVSARLDFDVLGIQDDFVSMLQGPYDKSDAPARPSTADRYFCMLFPCPG